VEKGIPKEKRERERERKKKCVKRKQQIVTKIIYNNLHDHYI
jgi:hypothetical protein